MKRLFLVILACGGLCGCDRLEDNGVHMAVCLRDGAKKLAISKDTELVIQYEPLTGTNQIYDVEFCSNSVVLITGKREAPQRIISIMSGSVRISG
jgi:hypothetical protein